MVNNRRVPSLVSTRPRLSSAPLVAVISADSPRVEESSLVAISDNVSSRQAHGESPHAACWHGISTRSPSTYVCTLAGWGEPW